MTLAAFILYVLIPLGFVMLTIVKLSIAQSDYDAEPWCTCYGQSLDNQSNVPEYDPLPALETSEIRALT